MSRIEMPAPFWKSRIFLICAIAMVCLTVLVALDKLSIDTASLTTVFLGMIGTIAALSRRGRDLQPVQVNDNSAMIEALAGLAPSVINAINKSSHPLECAKAASAPPSASSSSPPDGSVQVEPSSIPRPDNSDRDQYIDKLLRAMKETSYYEQVSSGEFSPFTEDDLVALPEEWDALGIYSGLFNMAQAGMLYSMPRENNAATDDTDPT